MATRYVYPLFSSFFHFVNPEKEYDAFRGFRSHHIHMSVGVAAPHDREWSVSNLEPSKTYNSVHLTPRFFTHFFNWWSMFSGAMSLPIRQGALWPGVEKSSKKFGRHLATIKYSVLLSPLYMSHIYKHKDAEDYGSGVVAATGLKGRVDSFMLDLHQRREEFRTVVQAPKSQEDSKQNQTTGMRINQVQLDLIRTDVRAVSASITGSREEDLENASSETLAGYSAGHVRADLSKFNIPDNDWGWVDMDDFVELGWLLPSERNPETSILPLAFAPRFTYLRQTDHAESISGEPHRTSAFGYEPTHHCVMSARNDPRRIQCQLIEERLNRIKEQLAKNNRAIGDQELKIVRSVDDEPEMRKRLEQLQRFEDILRRKEQVLQSMHRGLVERLESNDLRPVPDGESEENDQYYEAQEEYDPAAAEDKDTANAKISESISDFNNRFIIHNIQLKWSNALRNIILRYIHQVSQRRGFVYYMSRKAVKFILDIVEEQNKAKQPPAFDSDGRPHTAPMSPRGDDEVSIHDRVEQLLADAKKFVDADDPDHAEGSKPPQRANGEGDIARDYISQNAYLVRLIAPQIQLQSEKDRKSAVLVAAKSIQLKIIQIMDKDRMTDEVSGLVQRRFTAAMDSLQIFVTTLAAFAADIHMYSGSTYGTPAGSDWPPWVPFEVMFEFHQQPYGFQRVIQRTSASLRYDKYNTLRLKYHDDVSAGEPQSARIPDSLETRMDQLWVDFPHVRVLCDSKQYYAIYVIVLDLLLYSEPLEKTRTERLEKIMLASDFSDLTGAPDLVIGLQERIRQLEEIKTVFQINEKYLDKQGWSDRIEVERDLAVFEDELFFVMKAITTAQRKQDDRAQTKQSTGLLRYYISASEIVWHLLRGGQQSLAEFQLKNVLYDRTDNTDGSNLNSVEIEQVMGFNLLPNALYPKMISPYIDNNRPFIEGRDTKMLRVHWLMLEAIAGIPVMDYFEVNLFPLKLQLEYEIGKKLFEYIFPGIKDSTMGNGLSPFLVKHMMPASEEDEDDISLSSSQIPRSIPDNDEEAKALNMRLVPTLHLPSAQERSPPKPKSSHGKPPNVHHLRLFRENPSRSYTDTRSLLHPRSAASETSSMTSSRPGSTRSGVSAASNDSDKTTRKFTLIRANTGEKPSKKPQRSDDVTEMMTRASNYMTLAYVKIPSMVLCLSYKGKGNRNFEDVHDLVFRMPNLEYRNKTWSNLDLALQLKKDVIRALISHAGAIVSNKMSRHRPSKQATSRLRQIANSSTMLATSPDLGYHSDSNSMRDHSPAGSDVSGEPPTRRSFASGRGSTFSGMSEHCSTRSGHSGGDGANGVLVGNWQDDESIIEDGRDFADELSRVDQTEPDHASFLSRHLTPFAHKPRSGSFRDSASARELGVEP